MHGHMLQTVVWLVMKSKSKQQEHVGIVVKLAIVSHVSLNAAYMHLCTHKHCAKQLWYSSTADALCRLRVLRFSYSTGILRIVKCHLQAASSDNAIPT